MAVLAAPNTVGVQDNTREPLEKQAQLRRTAPCDALGRVSQLAPWQGHRCARTVSFFGASIDSVSTCDRRQAVQSVRDIGEHLLDGLLAVDLDE